MQGRVIKDILFPELSYQIVGVCFEVFKLMGPGHHEKVYQRAVATELGRRKLEFKKELSVTTYFKETVVGRSYLDFLVEGKVILELKKDSGFSKHHIDQVLKYLRETNLQLGILVNFTQQGVVSRRIVNIHPPISPT